MGGGGGGQPHQHQAQQREREGIVVKEKVATDPEHFRFTTLGFNEYCKTFCLEGLLRAVLDWQNIFLILKFSLGAVLEGHRVFLEYY